MSLRKGLLAAGALLIAVVLALPFLIDANRFRGPLQAQLEKSLDRPVTLGNMSLKVFPLSLRVADVVIGQPRGFVSQIPFLQAKEVFIRVGLFPLLRGTVDVQAVELQSPAVELIRAASGKWNYETSGGSSSDAIPTLAITDGALAMTDLQAKSPREIYEHIDARWQDNRSLTAKVRLETMRVQAAVDALYENGLAKGTLTLQGDDAKQPLTVTFDLQQSGETWSIQQLTAKLGAMALAVNGKVTGKQLQLTAKTAQAPVGDLLQIAGIFGGKLPPDLKVQGLLTADIAITGTTNRPLLNGKLEASQAEFSSKDLAAPVRASALRVAMTPATLTTEPFTLETGGTKLLARATIRDYSDDDPKVQATLRTDGASVEELLRMASAYGVRPEGLTGSGTVTLDLQINDSTYSGSGSLRGVSLTTPALPRPLQITQANVKFAADSIILDDAQWAIGSTHARGSLAVKSFKKPQITFNAAVDQIDVAEWQAWNPPPGKSKSTSPLTANGTLSAGKVNVDGVLLEDVKATIAYANEQLRMEPFTARLFGGQQSGAATADLRSTPAQITLQSTLTNIEASQLLAATSPVKGFVSGPLSGKVNLAFSPKAGEEIARTLNGSMELQLANGKMNGVQMLNEMAGIGRLLGVMKIKETFTDIVQFGGTLQLVNGVATTKDLALDFGPGKLTGEGTLGLVDQKINLRITTVMGKEFAAKAGGGTVGGIMGSIFSSPQGQLIIPSIVTGTFGQPRFAPDAERAARLKVEGMGGVGAAAGSILDRFRKKK
jgi:AsmA protein